VRHEGVAAGVGASGGTSGTGEVFVSAEDADVLPDTDPLARAAFVRQPAIHRRSTVRRSASPPIEPKRSSTARDA